MAQFPIHHKKCPYCGYKDFSKRGYFYKKSTKTYIPRFHCNHCNKNFSTRTLSPAFKQKKSFLNRTLCKLFAGGVSLREAARIVGCNYKTAYTRWVWLGTLAKDDVLSRKLRGQELEFDELLSIEHTKLKPLSVIVAVNEHYEIAGVKVAKIKAFGHLSSVSLQKYGPRPDEIKAKLPELLQEISSRNPNIQIIKSDKKLSYIKAVKKAFPKAQHLIFLADDKKEKTREQRYLNHNKRKFDPLFKINHTCAKLRDHIKRLTRRSWCTTKKSEHLELGLYLYIAKSNNFAFLK
ncbi:hypothetical protein [Bdellovibrio sp. HCB2-146]|uniref:hypothetical protein n=1 Tax=Bdellovibrio sp. HCB2-146 TaxID=3394362 RepID=UPI0039BC74C1